MSPRNENEQDLPEQNQDQRVQRHDEHPTRLRLHEPNVIIDVSEHDTDNFMEFQSAFNRTPTGDLVANILTDILLNESGTYDDFWLELRYEREQQQRQDSEDPTERTTVIVP